ncbi:DUF7342 family protein [Halorubrum sp. AS12]|uniref:DUF7342 family protein n=1 Tax=Halorubrum sp. AS12 TaxID=3409687 RepID=UPI003DA77CF5
MSEVSPAVEAWKENASAFDRVQSVASALSEPQTASYIANEAYVAENTARKHLERLVDLNVLITSEREGTTHYSADPLHTRLQTLRELLEQNDRDDLIELKSELQSEIEGWSDEYGVDSPSELRARAAETGTAAQTRAVKTTASDWELVSYRLSIVEDAIENYAEYDRDYRASA